MKVYTEVNYIWKDDKLVQTDSQSFDYEGEVDQCHTRKTYFGINIPHGHGSSEQASKNITEAWESAGQVITDNTRDDLKKPGGDVKRGTDWLKSLSQKAELALWGHSSGDDKPDKPKDDSDGSEYFAKSRKTRLGAGREGEDKDSDERRGLSAMDMGTLLTQGQKAKKLPTA
tara:strand:+ start:945 stop:1460 length:516 start_codon:yes stop_codon:yes gene_type:complete